MQDSILNSPWPGIPDKHGIYTYVVFIQNSPILATGLTNLLVQEVHIVHLKLRIYANVP